ncbi:hypothetical protein [uncultured Mediterranean phage uvMED]|nr:hypothetical protein [uncultured Mediterranean phage uvMED]
MYTELKYVKTEVFPNEFVTTISGKKNGYNCSVPINKKNSDYVAIMQLVDAGSLTIAGTNNKYFCFEDGTEKDES